MDDLVLKEKIRQLAFALHAIAHEDYPVIDLHLQQEVARLRSEILQHFGLPGTSDFLSLLDWGRNLSEYEIDQAIETLKEAATVYLLTVPPPDIKLLSDAQRQGMEAAEVLSLLQFKLHVYNFFVYENILLAGKGSPENVYSALLKANDYQILNGLGQLASSGRLGQEEKKIQRKMQKLGVLYLHEFLETYLVKDKKEK